MGIEPISQWSRRLPLDVLDFRDERGCRVQKVPDQTRQVAETNRLPAGRQQPPTPEPSLSQKQRNNKYRVRCNVSLYSWFDLEDRTENNVCLLFHAGFHSHAQPLARPLAPPEAASADLSALRCFQPSQGSKARWILAKRISTSVPGGGGGLATQPLPPHSDVSWAKNSSQRILCSDAAAATFAIRSKPSWDSRCCCRCCCLWLSVACD